MQEKKERIINEVDQDLIRSIMAEIRRRMQVCHQRYRTHIEGNKNLPRTLEIIIYYVFVLNIEISISFYTTTFY